MSRRGPGVEGQVLSRTQLDPHLVRVEIGGPGLATFESTGILDEWVGLVVPGQFQSRYYSVRSWDGERLVLDVVVHERGLVTEWVMGDCVGDTVTIQPPQGSFAMPGAAEWLYLVGDLTAFPSMARITEAVRDRVAVQVWAEAPERIEGYFPDGLEEAGSLTWIDLAPEGSQLASLVESFDWPQAPGYFWMAGESAQMRAIRRHLMHEVKDPSFTHDVMGYWRKPSDKPRRTVDPGPIYRAGKAAGKSDEEIWAEYDALRVVDPDAAM